MVFSNNLLMGAAGQASGYEIEQSIRFNDDDSAHLSRTLGTASNRKIWTYSVWIKRCTLGTRQMFFTVAAGGGAQGILEFDQGDGGTGGMDKLIVNNETSGTTALNWELEIAFRDPAAWYHFVFVYDTTQSTTNDRFKCYINGVQQTEGWDRNSTPGQNEQQAFNNALDHRIGEGHTAANYFDGYMAEINFIDGTAKAASDFGEYNSSGVWVPIEYTGSYGNNGFFIDGRDSSDLGDDESGNGNDFASSGLAAADQMPDTPTLNHWTLNPLDSGGTLANGNLQNKGGNSTNTHAPAFPKTGKWYVEIDCIDINTGTTGAHFFGICDASVPYSASFSDHAATSAGQQRGGQLKKDNSNTSSGTAVNDGDVIALAFDADNLTLDLYVNNSASGSQITSLTDVQYKLWIQDGGTVTNMQFNFAEASLEYTPPTGFKALSTANLPTPTISDGSKYFDTKLWTGNDTDGRAITGYNFSPDLVWIKSRSGAYSHNITDTVRGVGNFIQSNTTDVEVDGPGAFGSTLAFTSDGFTLDNGTSDNLYVNAGSETYAGWAWEANGSGSSNEDGSINTTATSVNTTSGFSISTYTGTGSAATIGHGLGVAPKLIIVKKRVSGTDDAWIIWHTSLSGANYYLNFDTGAQDTSVNYWNNTLPTSSVFSVGASNGTNESSKTFVAYCFAEIEGYSSFGGYTGNGNADGPFIYTGFKPAFLMYKVTSTTDSWEMYDTQRQTFNPYGTQLKANLHNAETDDTRVDLLGNGFKVRSSNTAINTSSGTYIYIAFAEHPFGGDGIAPTTAR